MKIGDKLLKELRKKYEPSSLVHFQFGRFNAAVKTDEDGNAIMLFIGKEYSSGLIQGNRFTRVLVKDKSGKIIKDHWDHKGKV